MIPVIPNEVGFGVSANYGGSGRHLSPPSTNVVRVTSLDDYDDRVAGDTPVPGTLRYALEQELSPKTIIFDVSGVINLVQRNIEIGGLFGADAATKGSYITVAGQTAPTGGITLRDYGIKIERNCSHILIQYLRIRPGDLTLAGSPAKEDIADSVTIVGQYDVAQPWVAAQNIAFDHCSLSWSGDMNIQSNGNDVTFINCISSYALHSNLHPKGPHSKGGLFSNNRIWVEGGEGNERVDVRKCLFSHNEDRNARCSGGSMAFINNVLVDCRFPAHWTDSDPDMGRTLGTHWGCYMLRGAVFVSDGDATIGTATRTDIRVTLGTLTHAEGINSRMFIAENSILHDGTRSTTPFDRFPTITDIECKQRFTGPESSNPVPEINRAETPPIWPDGYVAMTASDTLTHVHANAGCRPLDSVDQSVIDELLLDRSLIPRRFIASEDEIGGQPAVTPVSDPNDLPGDLNDIQGHGYTALEAYIHGLPQSPHTPQGRRRSRSSRGGRPLNSVSGRKVRSLMRQGRWLFKQL